MFTAPQISRTANAIQPMQHGITRISHAADRFMPCWRVTGAPSVLTTFSFITILPTVWPELDAM